MRSIAISVVVGVLAFCLHAGFTPDESESGTLEASWYGEELRGSTTASGEPYDPDRHTAASKTLPLGTRLRVCKESCTEVRVNDTGPYVEGRDLDLSEAAAESIGLKDEGTGSVSVEQTSSQPVTELPKTGGVNTQ